MRRSNRYVIILEDEWRLQRVARCRVSSWRLWGLLALVLSVIAGLAVALIMLTPLRNLLPGYIPEGQRAQVESATLRVDSIKNANDVNEAYIKNILKLLDTERSPDSPESAMPRLAGSTDSLITASPRERSYLQAYNNREKYNVSVLAPLAAENMAFLPVSSRAVVAEETKESKKIKVLLPSSEGVMAIADGTVLEVVRMSKEGGGSCVIQHANGFVSRYSHLADLRIAPGSRVQAGEIISLQKGGADVAPDYIWLQIWRHGDALKPASIISGN